MQINYDRCLARIKLDRKRRVESLYEQFQLVSATSDAHELTADYTLDPGYDALVLPGHFPFSIR